MEYALLAGLFLIAVVGGLQLIEQRGAERAEGEASSLVVDGGTTSVGAGASTTTTAGGATTSTTSASGASSTTTTAPTTTTTASSPTTGAPTTTTSTTATTTPGTVPAWATMSFTASSQWVTQGQWHSAWNATFRVTYDWPKAADATVEVTRIAADGTRHVSQEPFHTANRSIVVRTDFGPSTPASDKIVAVEIRVTQVKAYDANWQLLIMDAPGISARTTIPS